MRSSMSAEVDPQLRHRRAARPGRWRDRSRSRPRSSAKWLRVPALITRNGRSCSAATCGDQRLGAVAAGHAEQVGAVGDGLAGQRVDIDRARAVEQDHVAPSASALRTRSKRSTLPPPERGFISSTGRCGGGESTSAIAPSVSGRKRCPSGHRGQRGEHVGDDHHPQQIPVGEHEQHHDRCGDGDAEQHPAHHPPVQQGVVQRRNGDREPDERGDEQEEGAHRAGEHHQHERSGQREREREACPPASGLRDLGDGHPPIVTDCPTRDGWIARVPAKQRR